MWIVKLIVLYAIYIPTRRVWPDSYIAGYVIGAGSIIALEFIDSFVKGIRKARTKG